MLRIAKLSAGRRAGYGVLSAFWRGFRRLYRPKRSRMHCPQTAAPACSNISRAEDVRQRRSYSLAAARIMRLGDGLGIRLGY